MSRARCASMWLKLTAVGWAAICPILLQAADTQAKYKEPDLPKQELAVLVFHPYSDVRVLSIDAVEFNPSKFFARNANVSLLPGIHVLVVRLEQSWSNGGGGCFGGVCYGGGGTSITTQASTLLVDVKKGRRYVLTAWYFRNGTPVRFTAAAEQERSETAKNFAPDSSAKYPWLNNIHFEIADVTDLAEVKLGTQKFPDLRWITYADWKWNREESKAGVPYPFDTLNKQIAAKPADPWPHRERALAELWTAKPDYEKAIAEATKAIELNPSWARGYQERAWIWQTMGKLDKEIEDLDKAVALEPQFSLALMMLGNAWQGYGDSGKAIASLTRATEADACNAWSYCRRGEIWMNKGELDKALEDENRAIAIAPRLAPAYSARAAVWVKKQDYDKAIADYSAAIDNDLKLFSAYMARAELLNVKNQVDKAIADCSHALKIDDRNANAYATRGALYQKQGNYDPAIADFTKALEIQPSAYQVLKLRGSCWFKKGDRDRSMADFAEALRLQPEDISTNESLGYLYAQKGEGVRAADYYMKAGQFRVAQKDFKNAGADWSAAIAVDPRRATAFGQRAEVYAQLGQADLAIADYTQALKLTPGQAQWAQRLDELKRAPHSAAPSQPPARAGATAPVAATAATAAAPAAASSQAPAANADKAKVVIQGTLLHYPDRKALAGKGVILGFLHGDGFVEPNYGPRAVTDSNGVFRLEYGDKMLGVVQPGDKRFSLLVYDNWDAVVHDQDPIGAVVHIVKGRTTAHDWELPRESGVVNLDESGALFLNQGK